MHDEKRRDKQAEYRRANSAKHALQAREWAVANPAKIKQQQAQWYASRSDEQKALMHAKSILARDIGVPEYELPPALIEAKAAQLLVKKATRESDHQLKRSGNPGNR